MGIAKFASFSVFTAFLVFPAVICAQHLGAPALEPGLGSRSDIVFFEDFESSDWYTHWNRSSVPQNCSLVTNPAYDSARALRVFVAQGEHYGVSFGFDFADQGLNEPEEIYFRYYVFIPDNWRRNNGEVGKLPGISGTYGLGGWGGRPVNGDSGWSARMMNRDCDDLVKVGFYCYHADMTGTYGDHLGWEIDSLGYLTRNRWHGIEAYARMNTITSGLGNNDGALRGWVNGELAYENTGLRFRDTSFLKIERIWFNIYVGGSWTAPQDMEIFFDNVVIARSYIGPKADVGIETAVAAEPDHFGISVIPNPFAGTVKIMINGVMAGAVETLHPRVDNHGRAGCNVSTYPRVAIYDIHGKLIADFNSAIRNPQSAIEWNPSGLPAGIYLARLTGPKTVLTKRLFLVR
jgi:hypothetical protein